MSENSSDRRKIEDLATLATFLDSRFPTPFGIRIGWDGIIGLIPGIGSVITTALSAIIVFQGIQLGASAFVVLRMILNIVIDDVIGAVPFFGWIGDFFWKSNEKNVRLLEAYLVSPVTTNRNSRLLIGGLVGVAFFAISALLLFAGLLTYMTVLYIYTLASGHLK